MQNSIWSTYFNSLFILMMRINTEIFNLAFGQDHYFVELAVQTLRLLLFI